MEETKKKRVLIIEDEESYASVEAMLIEEIGFEPIIPGTVKNPEQAIEWIMKYESDIILLDMNTALGQSLTIRRTDLKSLNHYPRKSGKKSYAFRETSPLILIIYTPLV